MSDEKILLTAAEVAKLTGFAEGTIRHFVSQKRIPVVRISARCVRFRRSDIDSWLEQQLVPSGGRHHAVMEQCHLRHAKSFRQLELGRPKEERKR